MITIRNYSSSDYQELIGLYKQSELYGGQFDANRDSKEKLAKVTNRDPEAILIAELDGKIFGTISLIEDGRVAWLFRFAILKNEFANEATQLLYNKAAQILKSRGHNQILVYSPTGDSDLENRYKFLGFEKGNNYTAFWKDI